MSTPSTIAFGPKVPCSIPLKAIFDTVSLQTHETRHDLTVRANDMGRNSMMPTDVILCG
jgi:hypothetical protein